MARYKHIDNNRRQVQDAMRAILGYRSFFDLRRGWRFNNPNLEQLGLVRIGYQDIDELAADDAEWADAPAVLQGAKPAERANVLRTLFEVMRQGLCVATRFYHALGRYAALARSLPNRVVERFTAATAKLPMTTEAERLVVQRIGQNLFRKALIDFWQGRCAVTGLDVVPLLRASHIKPWAVCASDEVRLDVFNGLLLAPHLDALFDGGWITFADDGGMLVSGALGEDARNKLGLRSWTGLLHVSEPHGPYLEYHRSGVFRRG